MTAPPSADGSPDPAGAPTDAAPFLPPPARPSAPSTTAPDGSAVDPFLGRPPAGSAPAPTALDESAAAPFLPSPPPPAAAAPLSPPAFDAKAMVDSQKHAKPNPAYGAMPVGTEEGRAAARRLREDANRKRRRNRRIVRLVGLAVLVALAVGAYFAVRAIRDDDAEPPGDVALRGDVTADDAGGALTPLGEQEQVIEGLDDLNSGATPSAGGLLDAVEDAREIVGQAEPPVGAPTTLLVADVFTPAVLDHTDVLGTADGWELFAVRAADLAAVNPSAHTVLVERLLTLPQVAADDPRLAPAPVVPPGDVAVAVRREGDVIAGIVATATDPAIGAVGP